MERWRPIAGYENTYEVSDHGRVRSILRHTKAGRRGGKVLAGYVAKRGYRVVSLCVNNKAKLRYVHQLVLETFVSQRPDGMETRHRNGIATDNRLSNLKWGTHERNCDDQRKHGTRKGERHHGARLTDDDVRHIFDLRNIGRKLREIAEIKGVSISTVSMILLRKRWSHVDA